MKEQLRLKAWAWAPPVYVEREREREREEALSRGGVLDGKDSVSGADAREGGRDGGRDCVCERGSGGETVD
jgi:hypothetical protein